MADFRAVEVRALKWFPQSRKTVPVTPVRVQVPASRCSITLCPGRYGVELDLVGHAAHTLFVQFVRDVEQHAREHARPSSKDLTWRSCLDEGALVPRLRLSAFDATRFFDAEGQPCHEPTAFEGCSCLLELTGAWTTDVSWGLRWNLVEVKRAPHAASLQPPCLFLEDDEQPPAPPPPMFLDDDDTSRGVGPCSL